MEEITIYTDGGCSGNPGPGGWGAVILADGREQLLSGGESFTTNNRMELTAAISVLSAIASIPSFSGRKITLYIDSQYVKNGITTWITNWKQRQWRTSEKKPVKNQDLWKQLDELNSSLDVNWQWVKGHSGVEYNEICDALCHKEMERFK